jgi:hypothetical protein
MPNTSHGGNVSSLPAIASYVEAAPISAGTAQAGAPAVQLGDAPARAVFIQNPAGASAPVYVGDADAQPVELAPGAAITVPCEQISQVYVRSDDGAQQVAFIAQLQNS